MSIPLPLFHPYLLSHWISLWQNDGFSFLWEDSPFPLYPHPNSAILSTTAEHSSENLAPLHGAEGLRLIHRPLLSQEPHPTSFPYPPSRQGPPSTLDPTLQLLSRLTPASCPS